MTIDEFNDRWQPEKMIAALNDMFDELIEIAETHDIIHETDHMIRLAQMFYHPTDDVFKHYASLVLRGTINQIFMASDFYLNRITDEGHYDQALEVFREEFTKLMNHLREIVTKHIRTLDRGMAELPEPYLRGDTNEDGLTDEVRQQLLAPAI